MSKLGENVENVDGNSKPDQVMADEQVSNSVKEDKSAEMEAQSNSTAEKEKKEEVPKGDEPMETEQEKDKEEAKSEEQSNNKSDEAESEGSPEKKKEKESPAKKTPGRKKKETPSPTKASPAKTPKKGEEKQKQEEGDKDDKKPLFEQDAVVEGKRRRSTVQRLAVAEQPTEKSSKKFVPKGTGKSLGDFPFICEQLNKKDSKHFKDLHHILYNTPGKATIVKREIRAFTGYGFDKDSDAFKKKRASLMKMTQNQVNEIKSILGLMHHGNTASKEDKVDLVMNFLNQPEHIDRKGKTETKKSSGGESGKKKRRSTKSKDKTSDEDEEKDSGSDSDKEKDDDSDDSEKKKKTRKRKAPAAKPKIKLSDKKKTPSSKSKKSSSSSSSSDNDSDSDKKKDSDKDEEESTPPPPKKAKKEDNKAKGKEDKDEGEEEDAILETDAELDAAIQKKLKNADLSEVTMKQICEGMMTKYPKANLGERLSHLKSRVRTALESM